MVAKISERLKKLSGSAGVLTWLDFSAEDRDLIRIALLYDAYHQCFTQFDQLIVKQISAGDVPCQVSFADEILRLLSQSGFTEEESLRYFVFFISCAEPGISSTTVSSAEISQS